MKQKDDYNCGVYTCHNIELIVKEGLTEEQILNGFAYPQGEEYILKVKRTQLSILTHIPEHKILVKHDDSIQEQEVNDASSERSDRRRDKKR